MPELHLALHRVVRSRMRGARIAAVAALFSTLVIASGASAAPDTFEIPTILSLTGSATATGAEEAEALRVLQEAVNKSGGVRGRPIEFAIQDDQSTTQLAVQLANGVIAKHSSVMFGPTLAGTCSAVLPLVSSGPLTYCLSSGMYPPKDSYMFVQGVPTKETLRLQIKFFRDHGWRRLATIFTTDATGQDYERNLDAALALPENSSMTLVSRQRFGVADVSVNAQIANIKASAPQAIIVWATGTPFGTALRALTDLGLDVPTGTTGANLNYQTMQRFKAILPPNLYFVNVPGIAPDAVPKGPVRTAAASFFDTLKAAGLKADAGNILAWDPGVIMVNMLKAVGFDASPAQYRQYLENLHDFYGASGFYDFRNGSQRGVDGRNDIALRYDASKEQFVAVGRIGSAFVK